ncbi:MAG: right-handed parallel beta-helix repeat-containing protein [Polyangia bacterium]
MAGLSLVLGLAGCWDTKPNPLYCDGVTLTCQSAGGRPYCDVVRHECEATPPDGSVGDLAGVDSAAGCADGSACTSADKPVCGASGACVECASNVDCAAQGKSCDPGTFTCVACNANADCSSGACRADHVCAAASDIVYVDNKNGACTGTSHAGTSADPYCQVGDAFAATGSTIVVAGSTKNYESIALSSATTKAVVGPGRDTTPTATFFTDAKPGLAVTLSSGAADVSATGIVLTGSSSGAGAPGLSGLASAGATARLTLTRSLITSSGGDGVDATGCAVTLDANEITSNHGGGIKLAGGTYTVTNNIIAANGNVTTGTVPGFVAATDAAAAGAGFAFNTVAKNLVSGGAGGIDCSLASHAITASIVTGNTTASATQFSGACAFTNVVAGSSEGSMATGLTRLDPAYVSTSNFRLDMTAGAPATANNQCCVDQLTSGGTDHDVDSKARPVRAKWDLGAFEAP